MPNTARVGGTCVRLMSWKRRRRSSNGRWTNWRRNVNRRRREHRSSARWKRRSMRRRSSFSSGPINNWRYTTLQRLYLYYRYKVIKTPSQATWAHMISYRLNSLRPMSRNLQPYTSLRCETTDTGLVYRLVCPFTPQLSLVPGYTAWWQRHMGVNEQLA